MAGTDLTMPTINDMSSWAKAVEESHQLPEPKESVKDGIKTRVEVLCNDNGDKVEVTSTFKVQTKRVPKAVALRSKWPKFGQCKDDPPGPNVKTTIPAEEIKMNFVRNRAGEMVVSTADDSAIKSLKKEGGGMHCRYCKQNDHFSVNCPYKDLLGIQDGTEEDGTTSAATQAEVASKIQSGIYVPPSSRGGPGGRPATTDRGRDENTIRVTNLPEETTDQDLRELFGNIGKLQRIYLAKDKNTGLSKVRCGFAFVTYEYRSDAEKAIMTISGHRYDYVILKVEWSNKDNK